MKKFRKRLYPTLLLEDKTFVKSQKFRNNRYVGNPLNTVQIFNQIGVDEIAILDIKAFKNGINFSYLSQIAREAFVPLAYGGGITSVEDAVKVVSLGFEKIILCSSFLDGESVSKDIANTIGSSSCALCLNLKKGFFSSDYYLYDHRNNKRLAKFNTELLKTIEDFGFGEIIVQSVDCEGTWSGYSKEVVRLIEQFNTDLPIVYLGGVNSCDEIKELMEVKKISAVSLSSFVLFQRKDQGVVLSFPSDKELVGS